MKETDFNLIISGYGLIFCSQIPKYKSLISQAERPLVKTNESPNLVL